MLTFDNFNNLWMAAVSTASNKIIDVKDVVEIKIKNVKNVTRIKNVCKH